MPVVGQGEAGEGWRKGLVPSPMCQRELLQPRLIFFCNSRAMGMIVCD